MFNWSATPPQPASRVLNAMDRKAYIRTIAKQIIGNSYYYGEDILTVTAVDDDGTIRGDLYKSISVDPEPVDVNAPKTSVRKIGVVTLPSDAIDHVAKSDSADITQMYPHRVEYVATDDRGDVIGRLPIYQNTSNADIEEFISKHNVVYIAKVSDSEDKKLARVK